MKLRDIWLDVCWSYEACGVRTHRLALTRDRLHTLDYDAIAYAYWLKWVTRSEALDNLG